MKRIAFRISVLLTLSVALISTSCQKKNMSVSYDKYQQEMRRNSLELENSEISAKYVNDNRIEAPTDLSVSTENTVASSVKLATSKSIAINNTKSATTKSGVNQSNIQQKKISKFEVLKSVAKARSGLNSNLKIGIVLLLIGVLVSIFLGWVGSIVGLIGLIFIIIGLLEIL